MKKIFPCSAFLSALFCCAVLFFSCTTTNNTFGDEFSSSQRKSSAKSSSAIASSSSAVVQSSSSNGNGSNEASSSSNGASSSSSSLQSNSSNNGASSSSLQSSSSRASSSSLQSSSSRANSSSAGEAECKDSSNKALFCEYTGDPENPSDKGGCFALNAQYSEPKTNCTDVISYCTDNYGNLYTGVTGLNADNGYGEGLKCSSKGGTAVSGGSTPKSSASKNSSASTGGSGDYCYYGPGNCYSMPTDDNCENGVLTNNCSSMTTKYCNWGKCVNGSGWNCESGGCYSLASKDETADCTDKYGKVVTTCPAGTAPPSADY